MKRPGFSRELAIAFALSVTVAIAFHAVQPLLGAWLTLRLAIAAAGAAFALAIFAATPTRVGRIAAVIGLAALDGGLVLAHAPLWIWACSQAGALWLLRCSYFHRSAIAAIGDLLLAGLAVGAAGYALFDRGSVFLAVWSYGVQALFVFLPLAAKPPENASSAASRFDQAQRTAEAALHRMTHV